MAEYTSRIIASPTEGAHDGRDDGLTGREPVSVGVAMVNFSPGPVGEPAGCTPYPVIEGVQDGWDDGLTGREPVGEIILMIEGVQDGRDGGLTGRDFLSAVETLIRGYPESVFGRRTAGYCVDKGGNRIFPLPTGSVVNITGTLATGVFDAATKTNPEGLYEAFLMGDYEKWYLIVEKASGRLVLYKKYSGAPDIDGDNLPDTLDLVFVKVAFVSREFGTHKGGLS